MHTLICCLVLFCAMAASGAGIGDTINIQFKASSDGWYTGNGAAGSGTLWNAFTGSSGTSMRNLRTANGEPSLIDFTVTYGARFYGDTTSGTDASVLLKHGLYGTVTFTFSDLSPLDTFSLYVYVGNKAEIATTISISSLGGASKIPSPVQNQSAFAINENYVVFSGLTPDATGQITGSVGGNWTALNGLQLQTTAVPEPGSMALICAGLAFLGAGRRVKRYASLLTPTSNPV